MADPVNPFNPYFPAFSRFFANRAREQAFFRQGLAQGLHPLGPGPWNVALLGPWGIGKTSLLRRFAEIVSQFDPPALAVTLTVTSAMTLPRLTHELMIRIHEEISTQKNWPERLREELLHWSPTVSVGPVHLTRHSSKESEFAEGDLYRELRRLWHEYLAGHISGLVVLLDDAHQLLVKDPNALLSLRGTFQDLQGSGARYPLVITGPDGLFEAVRDISEPITRFFERMRLGPFSLADSQAAIQGPLRSIDSPLTVNEDAIERLWQLTEGHPFFLTFAMRDIVQEATTTNQTLIKLEEVEAAWPSIATHLAAERFAVDWQSATEAEREVLRAIARDTQNMPITQTVGRSGTALLVRLVKKGLVLRSKRGEYRLYHPLFKDYIFGESNDHHQ